MSVSHPPTPNHPIPTPPDPISTAITQLLAVYDDPRREGLRDTPRRVSQMYRELLTPTPFTFTTFPAEGANQLVVVTDIPFYTLCEHHLIPFHGTATVGYLPGERIAGLSKLARTVDFFAHSLQTQERLTNEVADYLGSQLDPRGVGVVLTATHLCMAMRGVSKPGSLTTTSALRGSLLDDATQRAEFFALARAGSGK